MANEIVVATAALRDAAARLNTVSEFLHAKHMSTQIELRTVEAGSDNIVDAFNHFHGRWSDARGDIRTAVENASKFLTGTADAFDELERQLTAGLLGDGGTT